MKPGSILRWRRPSAVRIAEQYIIIKQKADDWLIYSVENSELFLLSNCWISENFTEVA